MILKIWPLEEPSYTVSVFNKKSLRHFVNTKKEYILYMIKCWTDHLLKKKKNTHTMIKRMESFSEVVLHKKNRRDILFIQKAVITYTKIGPIFSFDFV